ncbi:uncharacterized protein LOC144706131 [Wolffia australiana]
MKFPDQRSCQTVQNWTFSGMVGAFLDLSLTFFVLCGAMAAFLSSKFLQMFGQRLPCPCQGLFGRPGGECLLKNLSDYPPQKLSQVQKNLQRRFPFAPVCSQTEGSCCRFHWMNHQTPNIVVPKMDSEGDLCDSASSWNCGQGRNPVVCGSPLIDGGEVLHGSSSLRRRRIMLAAESPLTHQGPQNSLGKIEYSSSSAKQLTRLTLSENGLEEGDQNSRTIRILERSEFHARLALQLELEKERNAAASAADEAMAMILRLHREKASIEMEARQFERIVEERAAYDDEEMNILKEIIVRRERENHVLEKELEFYKLTMISGDGLHEQPNHSLETFGELKEQHCLELVAKDWMPAENSQSPGCPSPCAEERSKYIRIPGRNKLRDSVHTPSEAAEKDFFVTGQSLKPHLSDTSENVPIIGSDVSLARTEKSDSVQAERFTEDDKQGGNDEGFEDGIGSHDVRIMEKMMNTKRYSLSPIIRESEISSCDGVSKSSGRKTIDLKRRFSGSAFMEAQGDMNRKFSCSRMPFQPMNMSFDSISLSTFCKNSTSDKERFELEAEIEFLRDRLKIIQSGREKLSFSGHKEKENFPVAK